MVLVERGGGREQSAEVEAAALVVEDVGVDLQLVHAADHLLDRAEAERRHRLPVGLVDLSRLEQGRHGVSFKVKASFKS